MSLLTNIGRTECSRKWKKNNKLESIVYVVSTQKLNSKCQSNKERKASESIKVYYSWCIWELWKHRRLQKSFFFFAFNSKEFAKKQRTEKKPIQFTSYGIAFFALQTHLLFSLFFLTFVRIFFSMQTITVEPSMNMFPLIGSSGEHAQVETCDFFYSNHV